MWTRSLIIVRCTRNRLCRASSTAFSFVSTLPRTVSLSCCMVIRHLMSPPPLLFVVRPPPPRVVRLALHYMFRLRTHYKVPLHLQRRVLRNARLTEAGLLRRALPYIRLASARKKGVAQILLCRPTWPIAQGAILRPTQTLMTPRSPSVLLNLPS